MLHSVIFGATCNAISDKDFRTIVNMNLAVQKLHCKLRKVVQGNMAYLRHDPVNFMNLQCLTTVN